MTATNNSTPIDGINSRGDDRAWLESDVNLLLRYEAVLWHVLCKNSKGALKYLHFIVPDEDNRLRVDGNIAD
jgi:hypothetical protein